MRQPIEESVPEPVVPRPIVERSLPDRLRDWVEWFGVARLITSSVAVVVVCVGGWWLVRTPPPPPESALPVATVGAPAERATLPPPSSPQATTAPTVEPSVVVVHVAGAVLLPGVFELAPSSRVADAIDRAGGPSDEADIGLLNLAAPLVDGSRIYVPVVGEEVAATVLAPVVDGSAPPPAGPLDVNRATADELETLPGVGPATAAAIVAERERNGPFVAVADLERVPGIGPAKLAAITDLVTT